MRDLEEAERLTTSNGSMKAVAKSKHLAPRHPVNLVYRFSIIGGSLYGLHSMQVFHNIMKSPHVDHEWFKVGLAASIGEYTYYESFMYEIHMFFLY